MDNMKKTSGLLALMIVFSMLASFVVMPVSVSAATNLAPVIKAMDFSTKTITQEGGVKASDAAADPVWAWSKTSGFNPKYRLVEENGEKVVQIYDRKQYDGGNLQGVLLKNAGLKSGKTYKISVDLRADKFTVTGNSRDAYIVIQNIAGSKATWSGEVVGNAINLTGDKKGTGLWDWVHVEREFTMGTNASGTAELGADIGFQVGVHQNYNTYEYSFKNFELTEVIPLTGSAVANGTNAATFTFSSELDEDAKASDFQVTTPAGAKVPTLSVTTSGNTVYVAMSDYSYNTTYTISAKANGVTGGDGQVLSSAIPVVVTTEAPPVFSGVAYATGTHSATFAFTNNLSEDAVASDFAITAPPGARTPSLAVTTSGRTVVVTISGYSYSTEYTITAITNGVTDEHGQSLASPVSATVTTEETIVVPEEDVLFDLGLDNRPEGSMTDYGNELSSTSTMEVVYENDDRYVKVVDNDSSKKGGINTGDVSLSGKTTISFDLRRHSGELSLYVSSGYSHIITLQFWSSFIEAVNTARIEAVARPEIWENITLVIDPASNTFDFYKNGNLIKGDIPCRLNASSFNTIQVKLHAIDYGKSTEFDVKNFRVYRGEIIPPVTENIAERTLVDFANAPERLDEVLGNAIAMSIGNSMARVNNGYVRIDADDEYIAPFVGDSGCVFVPARFVAEKIGCSVETLSSTSLRFSKGGKVMEIEAGNKNAKINGAATAMPEAAVSKNGKLFVPLNFLAETYGKTVFWDERGLIIISDGQVVQSGDEDIIKPLLNQIRQYTTLYGNTKYSDVNFSSRYYRQDGHTSGTTTPQWGTLDASKRFMATFNRWTYDNVSSTVGAVTDQGLIVQGSFQPIFSEKTGSTLFLDGSLYQRYDGASGNKWGCVNDPELYDFLLSLGKKYIDMGISSFQFDDYPMNTNYQPAKGGCFCDNCMAEFAKYLSSSEVTAEELSEAKVTNPASFNYKEYLATVRISSWGTTTITKPENYYYIKSKNPKIDELWWRFNWYKVNQFHHRLSEALDDYAGEEVYYSVNAAGFASGFPEYAAFGIPIDGIMGETDQSETTAIGVFSSMLFAKAYGVTNVISPIPKNEKAEQLMHAAIPMSYATGQFPLVPWDVWLEGNTRYYATLEDLEHTYELPREYPWLFDNYEMPELVGYVYDFDNISSISDLNKVESSWATPAEVMQSGLPARAIVHRTDINKTIEANELKGLKALIAATDLSKIPSSETATINNSGITLVSRSDTASMNELKSKYWMTKSSKSDVYTILRQNQLYDNAPVVVHAVNYNAAEQTNVQVDINNLYLPEGETFTVNVYKPGKNSESFTVNRGSASTKITIDSVDRWTILEICGPKTVRCEAKFDLGTGINGIGLGTRVSNDKAIGTADDFTFVTYSEGINSTTSNDPNGNQDEAAFVYKRLGEEIKEGTYVSAKLTEADGAHGVMMREGVYSNARFAALVYDPEYGLRLAVREETNKPVGYKNVGYEEPAYMKLQVSGDEYVAYVSDDGEYYEEVARTSLALDEVVAGVFAASPDGSHAECRVTDLDISAPLYSIDVLAIDVDGEDFSDAAYIDKAGEAEISLKLNNNTASSITPVIMAASYNAGRLVSLDVVRQGTQVAGESSKTFDFSVTIPDLAENGTLEFFVLQDMNSLEPLISALKKSIKTKIN